MVEMDRESWQREKAGRDSRWWQLWHVWEPEKWVRLLFHRGKKRDVTDNDI